MVRNPFANICNRNIFLVTHICNQLVNFAEIALAVVRQTGAKQLQRIIAYCHSVLTEHRPCRRKNIFVTIFITSDNRHIVAAFPQRNQRRFFVQTAGTDNHQSIGRRSLQKNLEMLCQVIIGVFDDNHPSAAHQRLAGIFRKQSSRIRIHVRTVEINDLKRVVQIGADRSSQLFHIFRNQPFVRTVDHKSLNRRIVLFEILIYLCLFENHPNFPCC